MRTPGNNKHPTWNPPGQGWQNRTQEEHSEGERPCSEHNQHKHNTKGKGQLDCLIQRASGDKMAQKEALETQTPDGCATLPRNQQSGDIHVEAQESRADANGCVDSSTIGSSRAEQVNTSDRNQEPRYTGTDEAGVNRSTRTVGVQTDDSRMAQEDQRDRNSEFLELDTRSEQQVRQGRVDIGTSSLAPHQEYNRQRAPREEMLGMQTQHTSRGYIAQESRARPQHKGRWGPMRGYGPTQRNGTRWRVTRNTRPVGRTGQEGNTG